MQSCPIASDTETSICIVRDLQSCICKLFTLNTNIVARDSVESVRALRARTLRGPSKTQSAFASFYAKGALRRNSVQWTFYTLAVQFVGRLRSWCTRADLRPNKARKTHTVCFFCRSYARGSVVWTHEAFTAPICVLVLCFFTRRALRAVCTTKTGFAEAICL